MISNKIDYLKMTRRSKGKPFNLLSAGSRADVRYWFKANYSHLTKEFLSEIMNDERTKLNQAKAVYRSLVDDEMMRIKDRKAVITDYKVSGIWCEYFSDEVKDELRKLCKDMNLLENIVWAFEVYLHKPVYKG